MSGTAGTTSSSSSVRASRSTAAIAQVLRTGRPARWGYTLAEDDYRPPGQTGGARWSRRRSSSPVGCGGDDVDDLPRLVSARRRGAPGEVHQPRRRPPAGCQGLAEELAALADEQAALSRVAVLVATERSPKGSSTSSRGSRAAVPGARRQSSHAGRIQVQRWSSGAGSRGQHKRRRRPSSPAGSPTPLTLVRRTRPAAHVDSFAGWRARRPRDRALGIQVRGGRAGRRRRSTLGRRCRHERRSRRSTRAPRNGWPVRESRRRGDHQRRGARAAVRRRARDHPAPGTRAFARAQPSDGAQQRLVALSLALQLVQSRLDDDPCGARLESAWSWPCARGARELAAGSGDPPTAAVGSDRGACRAGLMRSSWGVCEVELPAPSKRPRTT